MLRPRGRLTTQLSLCRVFQGTVFNATSKTHSYNNGTSGGSATISQGQPIDDNRIVKLSRRDAINEWVDADGVTNGDTTYSYFDSPELTHKINTQFFVAQLNNWDVTYPKTMTGGWLVSKPSWPNVDYTWDITGDTATPLSDSGTVVAPLDEDTAPVQRFTKVKDGTPQFDTPRQRWENGTSTGVGKIVATYTATQRTDGYMNPQGPATATARYVLNVHDEVEWEGAGTSAPAPRRYSYMLDSNGDLVNITGSKVEEKGTSKEFATSADQTYDIGGSAGGSLSIPSGRAFKFLKRFLDAGRVPRVNPNTAQERDADDAFEFSVTFNKTWGTGTSVNNVYPLPYELNATEKAYAVSVRTYKWQLRPYRLFNVNGESKPDSVWYATHANSTGPGSNVTDDGKLWRCDYQERTSDAADVKWLKRDYDFYPNATDPVDWDAAETSFYSS